LASRQWQAGEHLLFWSELDVVALSYQPPQPPPARTAGLRAHMLHIRTLKMRIAAWPRQSHRSDPPALRCALVLERGSGVKTAPVEAEAKLGQALGSVARRFFF